MGEELQDKKAAALKATLELISEQGFHGTPMSQIAQRANIGVGTIYRYFAGKEELINALYIDIKIRFTNCIFRDYSDEKPVEECFKQLLRNIVLYYIEKPAELLFAEQYSNSPLITAATREEGMRMAEPINSFYMRGREQDLLKALPVEVLYTIIFGAVISLVKLYLAATEKPDESTMEIAIGAMWDMIKK